MILLVTTSMGARECAAALEAGCGHKTQVATSVPQALNRLQSAEYEALVIDQSLLELDPRALDTLWHHAGMAVPVYINMALHNSDRVVREAQVALHRLASERLLARKSVERALSSDLCSNLTGILLNSELALRQTSITPEVAERVRSIREEAEKMCSQLKVS